MPGHIVLWHEPAMGGHLGTINRDLVETVVHQGVRRLTEFDDTATAFESLFPGLHSGSIIAIKVNCIGPTDTRWEVVRGVVSGLSLMLGGTYDLSQVTIFDNARLEDHGYDESEFTFNGRHPFITNNNDGLGSGYYIWHHPDGIDHELSRHILNCDYLINIPVLKCHHNGNNQITVALKNHYGSCKPSCLCGFTDGMLTVNADPQIKDKTCLVLTDALRGTFTGGPTEPPQNWSNFDENTPNTLFFTTDPVTNEYWARDMINAQRVASGYSVKPCPWVEEASADPYNIGVSDPSQMTVLDEVPIQSQSWGSLKGMFR